ncbi:MAG: neuraminidase-like domain-containing protein, partial [Solirubrobacterales bacterium]
TRLRKSLSIAAELNLGERELRYFRAEASRFANFDLSSLPAVVASGTPISGAPQFAWFLRLINYARLKSEIAGGEDALIDVFEAAALDIDDAIELIAGLTRRDVATVKQTASAVSVTPALNDDRSIARLWDALQVVERLGAPVPSIVAWTAVVSPGASSGEQQSIARDMKEAIKAGLAPEVWQRTAQPIFDRLRQRQRDALVAHVMHTENFERVEQLFEYFLIDPGMEPVVQTSRIRLAIASLQIFIQRCLLNLEPKVSPATINSDQWQWMKRYRVWEANRKIFLYPENWLEPEFRDDKTHLFTELEGALLQGDVSSDLVEDAFLTYLKKLDELARLDIVAMHIEDDPDPARNRLHVFGRTFSEPHKYFYRRYEHQAWTAWEPVPVEIEGDHLAPVIWRERMYLFWVTFREHSRAPSPSSSDPVVTNLKLANIVAGTDRRDVEVHLHWSELVNGEWSVREDSSAVTPIMLRNNRVDWDPRDVSLHVSKEPYENGQERGVFVHVGAPIGRSFHLAGRNSPPRKTNAVPDRPAMPFAYNAERFSWYEDTASLVVNYRKTTVTKDGVEAKSSPAPHSVLALGPPVGGSFTILAGDNEIVLGSSEISELVKPIFYQDRVNTFFVEPTVDETTIEKWTGWITRPGKPNFEFEKENLAEIWEEYQVLPIFPERPPIPEPGDWNFLKDFDAPYKLNLKRDWLINPGSGLLYGKELVGPKGRVEVAVMPTSQIEDVVQQGSVMVNVHNASEVDATEVLIAPDEQTLEQAGFTKLAGGLNVVGASGLNTGLLKNITQFAEAGAAANENTAGLDKAGFPASAPVHG